MSDRKQVKSKERVADHGEVFTNEREVNAMLDLVGFECERLESRFLEPACGDGNFLIKVLDRKLSNAERTSKDLLDWKLKVAIIFSSLYGVELLPDNTMECRNRLFSYFYDNYYLRKSKKDIDVNFLNTIRYFLYTNIICGDALNMVDSNGNPLIFAEWGWISNKVQRRDFALSGLINDSKQAYIETNESDDQISLFESLPDEDFENAGLIKENVYRLVNYLELGELYEEGRL